MTANSPQADYSGVKRRVRTRQACGSCRRRRRKCDGRHPCSQCIGYSYPCQYNNEPDNDNQSHQDLDSVQNRGDHIYVEKHDRPTASPLSNFQQTSKPTSGKEGTADVDVDEQPTKPRPIVDTVKGRYSNAHSSILLPRRVGQSINLADRVRFHSYGWNLNTRQETVPSISPAVCRYLTYQELSVYSRVFFDVVDPMYHFLDQDKFIQECTKYWTTERDRPEDLEAVVAGVVALGSFFSQNANPLERELVEHAKQVLDLGCAYAPGKLSLSQTAGWVLRTLYLRLTTRPHLSWYASCCTLHVAEAMALHVDLRNVEITNKDSDLRVSECISSRGDLFECAVFLNSIISAEYGRSRVTLQDATELNSHAESNLMNLTSILHGLDSNQLLENMHGLLLSLQDLPDEPCVFALMKADVAIHLFRKYLSLHQEKMRSKLQDMLLTILRVGLAKVRRLLPSRRAWWNILSTPFQSLMVLLALDSDESLMMVEEAMSVLDEVHNTFPTTLSEEVLQTAQVLIQGLEKRKSRQAELLHKACQSSWRSQETFSIRGMDQISPDGLLTEQAGEVLDNWTNGNMNWNWISPGDLFYEQSIGNFDRLDSV